jgi:outer membrane immunogenic protein
MNKAYATLAAALMLSASPAASQETNWTGLYFGAHAGYGGADWDGYVGTTAGAPAGTIIPGSNDPSQTLSDEGGFGGAQVGFNWQLQNRIVLGIEADISWSDIEGSDTFDAGGPSPASSLWRKPHDLSLDQFGTVRARVGYAAGNLMPYVTGGFAWGRTDGDLAVAYYPAGSSTPFGTSYASTDENHTGWTLGGGIEWALMPNISIKAEYLHIDLGTEEYQFKGTVFNGAPFETDSFKSDLVVDTVRVGLNYRFGN